MMEGSLPIRSPIKPSRRLVFHLWQDQRPVSPPCPGSNISLQMPPLHPENRLRSVLLINTIEKRVTSRTSLNSHMSILRKDSITLLVNNHRRSNLATNLTRTLLLGGVSFSTPKLSILLKRVRIKRSKAEGRRLTGLHSTEHQVETCLEEWRNNKFNSLR